MQTAIALERAQTMKAIIQEGSGSADVLELRETEMPAINADQVLIRVHASTVNAAEYHTIHGGWLMTAASKVMRAKPEPVPGADVAGTIEAVGANVTELKPGDEVFGMGRGAWAEYATGSTRGILPKPRNVPFDQAACLGIAAITALQGLRDKGKAKAGDRVLVYGAGGGVGTFAVQIAKALGTHVTAVTGPNNLEIVRGLGADEVIDYTKEEVLGRGTKFDVILDIAAIRPIGALRRAVTPTGMLVLLGADKRGGMAIFTRLIAGLFRSRVLKQRLVFFVAHLNRDDLAFLGTLAGEGKIRSAIDREYPLSEAREAVRYAMSGQARAKVVITMS